MRLQAAVIALIEESNMEQVLDNLIPRVKAEYTQRQNISFCRCCPVALYLSDKTKEPIYVGWYCARYAERVNGEDTPLPDQITEYIRYRNPSLLEIVLPS